MGEAKRRGTFDQRLAMAVERNRKAELSFLPNAGPRMLAYQREHGTQKTLTKLIMAGATINTLLPNKP